MSLLEESFVLKKDLSIFALPEGVLLSEFFLCLFVHLFFLSGPWQVGRHVVIHRNLCIPDNICPGCASHVTAHLPGGIVSRATVLVSRWAPDAISLGCWIFFLLTQRNCHQVQHHAHADTTLAWSGVQTCREAIGADGLGEAWRWHGQMGHRKVGFGQNGQRSNSLLRNTRWDGGEQL